MPKQFVKVQRITKAIKYSVSYDIGYFKHSGIEIYFHENNGDFSFFCKRNKWTAVSFLELEAHES